MRAGDDEIDAAVAAAVNLLRSVFPRSTVAIREVIDDRGVVALLVTAGEGRLILGARSIDLPPVDWPWPEGIESTVGRLPRSPVLTVQEVLTGLVST